MALNMRGAVCGLSLLLVSANSLRGYAEAPFSYEPAIVVLEGSVTVERHYGPPNFGETPRKDKKEQVPILILDRAIDVLPDPKQSVNLDSYHNVRRLQLAGVLAARFLVLAGRRVVVKGRLFEKQTGENYTDVLVDVISIEKVSSAPAHRASGE